MGDALPLASNGQDSAGAGSIYDVVDAFTGRFDAITMFDVIEHLEDPSYVERHLGELGRINPVLRLAHIA